MVFLENETNYSVWIRGLHNESTKCSMLRTYITRVQRCEGEWQYTTRNVWSGTEIKYFEDLIQRYRKIKTLSTSVLYIHVLEMATETITN